MAPQAQSTARPGFLFIVCPDAKLLLETVEKQARAYAPAGAPFKRAVFWGDEAPTNTLWESLTVRDLFGSMRLVVVRQANLWLAQSWRTLDKLLSRPLQGSFPIFCIENEWDRMKPKLPALVAKTKCYEFAAKKGWVLTLPGLTDRNVREYIAGAAKARGLTLDGAAVTSLIENTPRQAGVLCSELDKLALIAEPGKTVSASMLTTAEWSPEAETFDCGGCVINGDAKGAWKQFSRLTDMEKTAFSLLGLLAWNLRTLWQLLAGEAPASTGRLTQAQARQLGAARLSKGMELIMETERDIKTGIPPRQAMEFTLSKLLVLFGAGH